MTPSFSDSLLVFEPRDGGYRIMPEQTKSTTRKIACPDHGRVEPRLVWRKSDDGRWHLGGHCPVCGLVLRWLGTQKKMPT